MAKKKKPTQREFRAFIARSASELLELLGLAHWKCSIRFLRHADSEDVEALKTPLRVTVKSKYRVCVLDIYPFLKELYEAGGAPACRSYLLHEFVHIMLDEPFELLLSRSPAATHKHIDALEERVVEHITRAILRAEGTWEPIELQHASHPPITRA